MQQHSHSGIYFASFSKSMSMRGITFHDQVTVPLDSGLAAELLTFSDSIFDLNKNLPSAKNFLEKLVRHPDSVLRMAAAQVEQINNSQMQALSHDPCFKVRLNLASNIKFVSATPAADLIEFARNDEQLAEQVLTRLMSTIKEVDSICDEQSYNLLNKGKNLFRAFGNHKDILVRRAAQDLADRISGTGKEAQPRKRAKLKFKHKRFFKPTLVCDRYFYALAFGENASEILNDEASPMIYLPVEEIETAVSYLPTSPKTDIMIERLARHNSARLRQAAARSPSLTDNTLQTLTTDPSYAVRCTLLENEEALCSLTNERILELIDGDEGLVEKYLKDFETKKRLLRKL